MMSAQEKDVKRVYCPECGKWLLCVDEKTEGIIIPFCKRCHKQVKINVFHDKNIKPTE